MNYSWFCYISGVDLTVAVENSDYLKFAWDADYSELGLTGDYDVNNYHLGLIKAGMSVHIIAKIDYLEDKWYLEIDSMQIIG